MAKVAASPLWANTAIFITWDDWGGWYDHVDPPQIATWPNDGTNYSGTQFRYGPRVPCLVLSPYARRGINSDFHSHVSIVKFCLRNFGLPPLGGFDADPKSLSNDMFSCFDFTQAPLAPPSPTPRVEIVELHHGTPDRLDSKSRTSILQEVKMERSDTH